MSKTYTHQDCEKTTPGLIYICYLQSVKFGITRNAKIFHEIPLKTNNYYPTATCDLRTISYISSIATITKPFVYFSDFLISPFFLCFAMSFHNKISHFANLVFSSRLLFAIGISRHAQFRVLTSTPNTSSKFPNVSTLLEKSYFDRIGPVEKAQMVQMKNEIDGLKSRVFVKRFANKKYQTQVLFIKVTEWWRFGWNLGIRTASQKQTLHKKINT
ncbi:hypothetical protein BpHYR1_017856 [Brachionus plicatilis]|uniref:Uncharacterized protein n=1 Tax=Brachionus plicatilis TaxID=10195 RepID=A0A3M7QZJ7_BRAPC|nr:hypothetical protein BpHYR1_017856 [Brachionus plicatilis]